MADNNSDNFEPIAESLQEGGVEVEKEAPKSVPLYKVMADTKIPVSSKLGAVWKSRRDQAKQKLSTTGMKDAWDECIRYYNNDQSTSNKIAAGRDPNVSRISAKGVEETDEHIETENIVFANTTALVPATYAKNPDVEVTAVDQQNPDHVEFALIAKRLINELFTRKMAPGINIKPKARKAVVMTCLTNVSYIEIGWTQRQDGSEVAMQQIAELANELEKAKTPQEIREVEGKLMAMEDKVDVLRPSGPWAKFRRPHDVLRDPAGTLSDLSDHNWIMVADYVPTNFLKAMYYEKKDPADPNTEYESIFAPTHILKGSDGNSAGHDLSEEVNTFSLLPDGDTEHKAYGFDDEDSFKKAQYTKVWYVWDKVTRRCMLFHDKDWKWPIWVWDDPTKLQRFFPLFPLEFYTDPEEDYARSEVMYYLDQQDAINEIHSERRRAISWARKNIFFNARTIKDTTTVDAFLSGGKVGAIGIDLPEGHKLTDQIYSVPPPSTNFMQLFDTAPYLQAVERVSSVSKVMQNAEFKTNTTNKAIESYQSGTQTRLDEKIDQIEDWIGDIGCGVLELCVQFMDADQVQQLLGDRAAQLWSKMTPMTPDDIRRNYSITIVGGSALKPTSATKKQQAVQVGQILGQFGANNPIALAIAVKVMERAFDDIVITDEDWQMLVGAINQQLQQQQQEQQEQSVLGMIDQLPPEAKLAMGKAMAQGVPAMQVVQQVMQKMKQGGGQQQPSGPQSPAQPPAQQ